jgi:hypothetical protein
MIYPMIKAVHPVAVGYHQAKAAFRLASRKRTNNCNEQLAWKPQEKPSPWRIQRVPGAFFVENRFVS